MRVKPTPRQLHAGSSPAGHLARWTGLELCAREVPRASEAPRGGSGQQKRGKRWTVKVPGKTAPEEKCRIQRPRDRGSQKMGPPAHSERGAARATWQAGLREEPFPRAGLGPPHSPAQNSKDQGTRDQAQRGERPLCGWVHIPFPGSPLPGTPVVTSHTLGAAPWPAVSRLTVRCPESLVEDQKVPAPLGLGFPSRGGLGEMVSGAARLGCSAPAHGKPRNGNSQGASLWDADVARDGIPGHWWCHSRPGCCPTSWMGHPRKDLAGNGRCKNIQGLALKSSHRPRLRTPQAGRSELLVRWFLPGGLGKE